MTDFAATAQQLLTHAIAQPDDTVIVANLDPQGGMVLTVRCNRTLDLIQAARSLLDDAVQRTQDELAAEEGDSQGDDPVEQRLSFLLAALDEINAIDGIAERDT
jgi:hypothetical protein